MPEPYLVAEITGRPAAVARIATSLGELRIIAELPQDGNTLALIGAHMHSDAKPDAFGPGALMQIAQVAMERMGYDEIVVEGPTRTSGANPGRRPGPFQFHRRTRAAQGEADP